MRHVWQGTISRLIARPNRGRRAAFTVAAAGGVGARRSGIIKEGRLRLDNNAPSAREDFRKRPCGNSSAADTARASRGSREDFVRGRTRSDQKRYDGSGRATKPTVNGKIIQPLENSMKLSESG